MAHRAWRAATSWRMRATMVSGAVSCRITSATPSVRSAGTSSSGMTPPPTTDAYLAQLAKDAEAEREAGSGAMAPITYSRRACDSFRKSHRTA